MLISLERLILPLSFVLGKPYYNNAAEYQDLIMGLEMTLDMKVPQLDVYGDSQFDHQSTLGQITNMLLC